MKGSTVRARVYDDVETSDWSDLKVSMALNKRHKAPMMTVYRVKNSKGIVFAMNKGITELLNKDLGHPYNYVLPHYSKKNNAIIFEFLEEYITYSVKISKYSANNGIFQMTGFFDYFDLPAPPHCICLKLRQEKIPNMGVRWIMYLNEAK
jgi:hypothetical protein